MKKLYSLYAAAAVAALASCSGGAGQKADTTTTDVNPVTETDATKAVYTGVLPAADTEGIEYTLTLDYTRDSDFKTGGFKMRQVYLSATDPTTYDSKGKFEVKTGTPQSATQRYVMLVPEVENGAPADTTYFLVTSDSTVTMVGRDLTPAASGLNYDLKLK